MTIFSTVRISSEIRTVGGDRQEDSFHRAKPVLPHHTQGLPTENPVI